MKKTLVIALAALALAACSKNKDGSVKLHNDLDSVAYVIGMNVGMNLMRMDSTLNVEAVCQGIRDHFRGKTRLTADEAETFFLSYVNYALPEKARAYEEQFLEDIRKSNRAYARTTSGVTYTVEDVGDAERTPVNERDSVVFRYLLRTADGEELYSSYERGDTVRTELRDLTEGLSESLKLLGEGGRIKAWMPSSAAYGAAGCDSLGVKPNQTLYYEIELLKVDRYANRMRRSNLNR